MDFSWVQKFQHYSLALQLSQRFSGTYLSLCWVMTAQTYLSQWVTNNVHHYGLLGCISFVSHKSKKAYLKFPTKSEWRTFYIFYLYIVLGKFYTIFKYDCKQEKFKTFSFTVCRSMFINLMRKMWDWAFSLWTEALEKKTQSCILQSVEWNSQKVTLITYWPEKSDWEK